MTPEVRQLLERVDAYLRGVFDGETKCAACGERGALSDCTPLTHIELEDLARDVSDTLAKAGR